ncbi:hypothetical protein AB0J43_22450 [Nonomuraea fuscirosea]
MNVATVTPDQIERAWRGFDLITAADLVGYENSTVAEPGWLQAEYRTRCGTGCCYAGHVAMDNGGLWLVQIGPGGEMLIDDTLVTDEDDEELRWSLWEYMLATPDDPEQDVEAVRGKKVIHVSARARRLLGRNGVNSLFSSGNTLPRLERLITEHFGPRPITLRQTRFVLAGTWPAEHATTITQHGWTVVNAPRPLAGPVTWQGDFVSGVFYAAGPLAECGRSWLADDATLLVPVTPAEVIDRIRTYYTKHGYDFDEIRRDDPETIGAAAEDLRLPWSADWLATLD